MDGVAPRRAWLERACPGHHEGRDAPFRRVVPALAVETGEDHVGTATARAVPENVAGPHTGKGGGSWVETRLQPASAVVRRVHDQEAEATPRLVRET